MATYLETAMGSSFWNDILATTQDKWLKNKAIQGIFRGGIDGNKTSSAYLAKVQSNKKNLSRGGAILKWAIENAVSDGGNMNPYNSYAISRKALNTPAYLEWSYLIVPVPMYGADQVMNSGAEQAIDLLKERTNNAFSRAHQVIAQAAYGNGVQFYNSSDFTATPGLENLNLPAGTPPAFGLGFGNDSNTNAVLSTTNTYANINRSAAANFNLRAKVLDATSATDMGASAGAFTTLDDMTIAHLRRLISKCRVGAEFPDLLVVGQDVWDHVWKLAEAARLVSNQDTEMKKWGFDNFMLNQTTVCCDPMYAYPTQITAINTNAFYPVFCAGAEPKLSQMQWLPGQGYDLMYTEIRGIYQFICEHPGTCGSIYNFTV